MKKFFTYLLAFAAVTTVISCSKSDEPDEPAQEPTITWPSNINSGTVDITDEIEVKIKVDVPAGIKTFKIGVESKALNENGITEINLIEPGKAAAKSADNNGTYSTKSGQITLEDIVKMILGDAGSPKDKTSYTLDLTKLVSWINEHTTEESDHKFTVTIGDKNNKTASKTFEFHKGTVTRPNKTSLKVLKFSEFNVRSITGRTVTFFDKLDDFPDKTSYFKYDDLVEKGLTSSDKNGILYDADGNKYRLPTFGELCLLLPYEYDDFFPGWGETVRSFGSPSIHNIPIIATQEGWIETIYLKNLTTFKTFNGISLGYEVDDETNANEIDGEFRISGRSWLKRGETNESNVYLGFFNETHNFAPVYGLRFQGTSQYAAYRWEYCKISNNNKRQRYLSVKIRILGKDDTSTKIDDVAKESFWTNNYIEFKFPASGIYDNYMNGLTGQGVFGEYLSSSLHWAPQHSINRFNGVMDFDYSCGNTCFVMDYYTANNYEDIIRKSRSLRLIRVE